MNRINTHPFLPVLLLTALALSSCSGKNTTVVPPGGSNGTVAATMVADTLPANPSLLSFQVTIASITFTPASGTATTVTLNPALTVDLMRLQSDTVFLGTFANIPAAQYSSVTLSLSGNANITFLNDTNATLSMCPANTVCPLSVAASSNPVATVSFTVSQNAVTGIGIDLNFANAVSISSGNLVVDFTKSNVLSAFTLPRANSNLASGQLDLIEDFTGVVSLNTNSVTIASSTRGTLIATATANAILDADPSRTLCVNPTQGQVSSCVSNNQVASMDVVLKSDGTLSIQEIEPLLATAQDTVEGTVSSINSTSVTQFGIIVTDKPSTLASSSLIGGLNVGDTLTVNIPSAKPFLVDTKGLLVSPGSLTFFANQFNNTALHPGQTVAVHVASFTAANGTTPASANADTVILRWSRFTATPINASTNNILNVTALPSYFNFGSSSQFVVQLFSGAQGTGGVTNFDGIASGTSVNNSRPVSLRALFIENPGNTANPAFFAAKVRQH